MVLVYIGRPFMSNPTLIEKLKNNKPLTEVDSNKLYTATAEGYIDYV